MNKKITMKDLADEFGVSVVTISKALSDKDGVSVELKESIKASAKAQGYTVDIRAKSMKTGKKYNIGIMLPYYYSKKESNFYFEVYIWMIELLEKHGYYATLHVISEETLRDLTMPRFCKDESIDGLIFLGQVEEEYLYKVKELNIPTVLADVNKDMENIVSVEFDNYLAGYELAKYLFNKGHKEIGFVGKIDGSRSILDRYLGCQRFLIEQGNYNSEKYLIPDRTENGGILREYTLPKECPTAYICNCDITAFYFIKSIEKKGIRIPDDISITAFDNTIFAQLSSPKVTVFETDVYEMAKNTVEYLIRLINGKSIHNYKSLIKGKLIERDSVKEI